MPKYKGYTIEENDGFYEIMRKGVIVEYATSEEKAKEWVDLQQKKSEEWKASLAIIDSF